MKDIKLRSLNELESRLYYDRVGRLNQMLADLQVDLSQPPPRAVESLARQTAALFEAIGFVPTPLGVMMREEGDILDAMTDNLTELVESGYAEAEAAWRFGPSSV